MADKFTFAQYKAQFPDDDACHMNHIMLLTF